MLLPPVVTIGASTGGVAALLDLASGLPADFPAIVAVVLHIGAQPSILPELLSRRGPLPAMHPRDGQQPMPGTIYVAPPDRHLLIAPDAIRLSRAARENHARPAIDPLFRTAALGWRERAIGVVLSGDLDDGTAGLSAIKACGGVAIVQDPATATMPSMPASALAHVAVDHCLALPQIAALLRQLVATADAADAADAPASQTGVPVDLQREQAAFEGQQPVANLSAIGVSSTLTCPACAGSLWELGALGSLRYRCHTGHAYSALSLEHAQLQIAEQAMYKSLRSLREREMLLRRLAAVAEAIGDAAQARVGRAQAERVREQAVALGRLIDGEIGGA